MSNVSYDPNGNINTMTHMGPVLSTDPNHSVMYDVMDAMVYTYKPSSNLLDKVTDMGTATNLSWTPDFRDGNTSGSDYEYADGNLTIDKNKGITQAIIYNYANKPTKININGNLIESYFTADGRLVRKVITPSGGSPETWDYIGDCVWKNNQLQHIAHAEGRVRLDQPTGNLIYDYYVKDHLQNVRTVLSTESIPYYPPIQQDWPHVPINLDPLSTGSGPTHSGWVEQAARGPLNYMATMEVAAANTEGQIWGSIDSVRNSKPVSTNPNDLMAARLFGGNPSESIGTSIMLRVMTGDQFDLAANSYYPQSSKHTTVGSTAHSIVGSLLTAMMGGTSNSVPVVESPDNVQVLNNTLSNPMFADALEGLRSENVDSAIPLSFLNYIVLDEHFNVLPDQSGAKQIQGDGQWATVTIDQPLRITQPGYVLVFTSNQSMGAAYWDKVSLIQYRGHVEQENHYYPFGLTLSSGYGNADNNRFRLTTKELINDFKLNVYDFGARMHDMQIGRWQQVDPLAEKYFNTSPYTFCGNSPIIHLDPDGRHVYYLNENGSGIAVVRQGLQSDDIFYTIKNDLTVEHYYTVSSPGVGVGYPDRTGTVGTDFQRLTDQEKISFVVYVKEFKPTAKVGYHTDVDPESAGRGMDSRIGEFQQNGAKSIGVTQGMPVDPRASDDVPGLSANAPRLPMPAEGANPLPSLPTGYSLPPQTKVTRRLSPPGGSGKNAEINSHTFVRPDGSLVPTTSKEYHKRELIRIPPNEHKQLWDTFHFNEQDITP